VSAVIVVTSMPPLVTARLAETNASRRTLVAPFAGEVDVTDGGAASDGMLAA
jgi:hypothetical protein